MSVHVFLTCHIVDKGVVFLHGIWVAPRTFGVEEEYLSILHADDEIDVKERLVTSFVFIADGIMLPASITILIPPIDILLVVF